MKRVPHSSDWLAHLGGPFVIVGDAMADVYLDGTAKGLAREAPVPVVRVGCDRILPGGAANAAMNLAAMGAHVTLVAAFGDDLWGKRLIAGLRAARVEVEPIIVPGRPTTQKVRIRVDDGHLNPPRIAFRYDVESTMPVPTAPIEKALARASRNKRALLVSDSGLGVVSASVIDRVNELARGVLPVIVDSRHQSLRFKGVTAVTPNDEEAAAALGRAVGTDAEAVSAVAEIVSRTGATTTLITRGARGVAVWADNAPALVPALTQDGAVDTTGAGDSAAAAFAMALLAGASPLDAAKLANHAGALAVRRAGTVAVNRAELLASFADEAATSRTVA